MAHFMVHNLAQVMVQVTKTVYTYFRNWRQDGTWISIHDQLRDWVRVDAERAASPSEAIIDSQSVKSAAMVTEEVGYDAGKKIKGRKRFMTVDTLGLVLRVLVTSAKMPERAGVTKQPGKTEFRPLSIPTIFDRALQAVVKATLEPEWEALQKYTELTH